jgi:hypothetical protein
MVFMNLLPPLEAGGVGHMKTDGYRRNVGEINLITDPESVIAKVMAKVRHNIGQKKFCWILPQDFS